MADELGAELSLDLDSARREVESFRRDLEDELDKAITSFADSYAQTVGGLPTIEPEIDSGIVTTELTRAVADADTTVTPDLDSSTVTASLIDAVEGAQPVATITADTDAITASLIDVVESTHPTLRPELDTSGIEVALDSITSGGGEDLATGFSDAELQGQELADTLGDLDTESAAAQDGLGNVSNVSTTLATAFSAARGDGRKLISDLAQIRGGFGLTATAVLGIGAGFSALFAAGERSLASVERAQVVLGDAAQRIEHINVGGLTGQLSELAIQAGVSGGSLRNAASSAAQMGLSSGKSTGEVTTFANNVNALALRAVALNPALGDAGQVAERLNLVLARGGRFLARYGLDLTAAEITTRALADTGKTAVRDLTLFERSVAGADIAVEKLGTNLGQDFERGTATATVRLASLRAELSAAFARAGRPLVEPTITGLEALAEAGTGVSTTLGHLGSAVLPGVALGLESLGHTAGIVSQVLGSIPPELILAGVAFAGLQRFTGIQIRDWESLAATIHGVGKELTTTVGGQSVIALTALTALDQGLNAVGTSTEELGVQFIATGAAIGFALGGLTGAAIGATIGGIAQMVSAETDLERATKEVDQAFQTAEGSASGLQDALFSNATTSQGLSDALSVLDTNLAHFVGTSGAFKALGLTEDFHKLGLSVSDVATLLQQGDAGFIAFVERARRSGEVTLDLGHALAQTFGPAEATAAGARFASEKLAQLGVSAHITAEEFLGLSHAEQRYVLDSLKADGANTDLLVGFRTMQRQIRAAERAQFELVAQTNHLAPILVDTARATSKNADGTTDWVGALKVLNFEILGIVPELGNMTQEAANATREFTGLSGALDAAAKSMPTLQSEFAKGLDTSFFEDLQIPNPIEDMPAIEVGDFLDTTKLVDSLNQTQADTEKFFTDIQTIAEAGASNTAAALLTLGPDNLGARITADLAANKESFRDGMEQALEGIAEAQAAGEAIIDELKQRIVVLAGLSPQQQEAIKAQFQVGDITAITSGQLKAYFEQYGTGGVKGADEFVDAFNREIVAKKIAGIPTGPIEESVENAKEAIRSANFDDDLDAAEQAAAAHASTTFPAVGDAAATAVQQGIDSNLDNAQHDGERLGDRTHDGIITGIIAAPHKPIGDAAARSTQEGIDAVLDDGHHSGEQLGKWTHDGIRTGVDDQPPEPIGDAAARAAQEGVDNALDRAFGSGAQLGATITAGIAAGIGSDAEARAAQQAIDEQLDRLQAEAEFHIGATSPAKAFIPLGRSIVQGVALGITSDAGVMASRFDAALDGLRGHPIHHGGGGGGWRDAPAPAAGASPFQVQVMLPDLGGGSSVDNSIHDLIVNNYGPDRDVRASHLTRQMRSHQFLNAGV